RRNEDEDPPEPVDDRGDRSEKLRQERQRPAKRRRSELGDVDRDADRDRGRENDRQDRRIEGPPDERESPEPLLDRVPLRARPERQAELRDRKCRVAPELQADRQDEQRDERREEPRPQPERSVIASPPASPDHRSVGSPESGFRGCSPFHSI